MNDSSTKEINELITHNFHGAFKFTKGDSYLFSSELIRNEGCH